MNLSQQSSSGKFFGQPRFEKSIIGLVVGSSHHQFGGNTAHFTVDPVFVGMRFIFYE
ncbi:hypothetical protein B6N60_05177 [Richelia sinica FACHB-800]|uniref:Uncharacterized protein n=1 Tax=Richelia sinica FACHB-800 TaxID=1357546 RepID=A0A975Y7K6_9NOST|nr:hypothetical protein B6N60_05177 [Richelia sinica FACHB-800]